MVKMLEPGEFGETSLLRVQACLRSLGFSCKARRGNYDDVVGASELPLIAFLKKNPQDVLGHFVVALRRENVDALDVYDPSSTAWPLLVTKEEFTRYWSGLVLAVGPAADRSWIDRVLWLAVVLGFAAFALTCWRRSSGSRPTRPGFRPVASILLIVLCADGASRCALAESDADAPAVAIKSAEESIDLGTLERIPADGRITVDFQWTNNTGSTLRISKATVGCVSCTTVAYDDALVQPGGALKASVTADLRGRYGEQVFAAMLGFDDDSARPKQLTIRCFRNMPPTASTQVINFGEVSPRGATRPLTLTAALRAGSAGLRSVGEVRSSNAAVSCELKDFSHVAIQIDQSGRKVTAGYTLRFEVRVAACQAPGSLEGDLSIPVFYNGSKMEVTIPFRGQLCGLLTSRPSSAICFATPAETERKFSLSVVWHDPQRLPSKVTVSCEHPRVSASFVPLEHAAKSDARQVVALGRVDASVSIGGADSLDTELVITGRTADGPVRLAVPLRVIVVGAPHDERR